MDSYSFKKTLKKGVKYFVIFVLPFLVTGFIENFPSIANLTIGAVLLLIVDYLKHKVGLRVLRFL
jgi:uncharacterized membrane-anchored protein